MNWKISITSHLVCLLAYSCTLSTIDENSIATYKSRHLIEVSELVEIIDSDSVVIIDFRKPSEYKKGHLLGALNIWRPDIENDSINYRGVRASKKKIEKLFSELGIRNSDFLIIYDNNASCDAARLWWVLDSYGFDRTALLHGGIHAWKKNGSLSHENEAKSASKFVLPDQVDTQHYIGFQEMAKTYSDASIKLIDNRSEGEYQGFFMKPGAYDSGRIEGSINIDWAHSVDHQNQTFKSELDLRTTFDSYGIEPLSDIVVYCHTGVRSSHTVFVLTELLGYKTVRNYDGSWVEWSYNKMPLVRSTVKSD